MKQIIKSSVSGSHWLPKQIFYVFMFIFFCFVHSFSRSLSLSCSSLFAFNKTTFSRFTQWIWIPCWPRLTVDNDVMRSNALHLNSLKCKRTETFSKNYIPFIWISLRNVLPFKQLFFLTSHNCIFVNLNFMCMWLTKAEIGGHTVFFVCSRLPIKKKKEKKNRK